MKYLYIDTSSNYLYSGLLVNDTLVGEIQKELNQDLSKDTLPLIAEMLEKANTKPNEINKIIVVDGPGSFTGIRIGITIAKVYAYCLDINITTINSLEAMSVSTEGEFIVPVIDARREYVYTAIYNDKQEILLEPQHMKIDNLLKELKKCKHYNIISNNEFQCFETITAYKPNIKNIILKFKDRKNINPHNVNPKYLKLTEAEEKLNTNDTITK